MTEHQTTARALAALGHDTRLAIFRLLVRAGEDALTVGEIGAHLNAAPSTLAHHLGALVDAGFIIQRRAGRDGIRIAMRVRHVLAFDQHALMGQHER